MPSNHRRSSKSWHLLFLSPELLSFGGMQRHDRLVISALDGYASSHGGRLSVYCLNDSVPETLPSEICRLEATELEFFSGNRVRFVAALGPALRRSSAVIYGLLGFAPIALAQRLINPRSRRVLFVHGVEAWHYRSSLHSLGVRQMQHIISVSQYTLDAFRRAYPGAPLEPNFVLANTVAPQLLAAGERVRASVAGPLRLLSVTRLSAHDGFKGIDRVLEALPTLLQRFPDLVYCIVGDGADRIRLERLASRLGVERAACFRGSVSEDELSQEFAACTIFVMPSLKEGFGLVFIEAMAYGKPVVAARATAVPEVVPHGEAGLLVEQDNVHELIEAISLLISDFALRERMGAAGRKIVQERYTFEALQERVSQILPQVMECSPR
jgi:glycosyltransferase involved in cell wall biosynthesis